jgi:hypothetical protein
MPEKPEKKESYQTPAQSGSPYGGHELPSQESIDLLTRLLLELKRGATSNGNNLPPEVERDIAAVGAAFESIKSALELGERPVEVDSVTPPRGPATGGTKVTIIGSHLLPGSTVRFGNVDAQDVSFVSQTEIRATAPPLTPPATPGPVDVVVTTFGGSATLPAGYIYQPSPQYQSQLQSQTQLQS